MSDTSKTTGSLVRKLAEVMKDVAKIPKNGTNNFHHYKYVMESDLVEAIRGKLAERHIFLTASTKGTEVIELSKVIPKTGEVVVSKIGMLRVDYTFHDGESGEKLTIEGIGEIDQDGGKGLYKALTGAMKYMLMKNFLVATGDDPEQDGGQAKPAAKTPARTAAPARATRQPLAPASAASPKQLDYITKLATERGLQVSQLYAEAGVKNTPTKDQASKIIDRLTGADQKPAEPSAKPKSPARPTVQQVMETLGSCTSIESLDGTYERATKYEWSEEDAQTLTETYDNQKKRIEETFQQAKREGMTVA